MNKKTTIIILFLVITMVVSGCVLRSQKSNIKNQNGAKLDIVNNQIQNQDQSSQIATSTTVDVVTSSENTTSSSAEIKYLPNGEIDTSDWLVYKGGIKTGDFKEPTYSLNYEIKYPNTWKCGESWMEEIGYVCENESGNWIENTIPGVRMGLIRKRQNEDLATFLDRIHHEETIDYSLSGGKGVRWMSAERLSPANLLESEVVKIILDNNKEFFISISGYVDFEKKEKAVVEAIIQSIKFK